MHYTGTHIQVIEIPAIESEYFDKSTVYTTETIIILVKAINHLKEIEKLLPNKPKIIVFNVNYPQTKVRGVYF